MSKSQKTDPSNNSTEISWRTATNVLEKVNNLIKENHTMPQHIHHYCSLDACMNILNNNELWVSSIEKMNDRSEINYTRDIVDVHLREYGETHTAEKELNERFTDMVNSCASARNKENPFSTKEFACSFSEDKDLLSQWRAYTNKGKGVSISFDTDVMDIASYRTQNVLGILSLIPSVYDKELQKQIIVSYIEALSKKNEFIDLPYLFLYFAGYFKHPAFSEEKEWRILSKASFENNVFTNSYTAVEYRNGARGLIPYMRWKFGELPKTPVMHITLGPQNETLIEDMKSFLHSVGLNNVTVSKSDIPYRD